MITDNESNKTPNSITVLFALITSIYFISVWLFFGEFNFAGLNWITFLDKNHSKTSLNPLIYSLILPPVILPFLGAFFIKIFSKRLVGIDIIPILLSLTVSYITIILTGSMQNAWANLIVLSRIVIVFSVLCVSFLILNKITNIIIIHSRFGSTFFSQKHNEIEEFKKNNAKIYNAWKISKSAKQKYVKVPTNNYHSKERTKQ